MGLGADTVRTVAVEFVADDVNLSSTIDAAKGSLAALTAVAGVAAAAIAFVGDETARLDDIAKGFSKSGLTVKSYQEMTQVATLAGSSVDNVAKATIKLAKNLQEVERGAGLPVRNALKEIGLELGDLANKSDTERLGVLADALNNVEREADRASQAQIILGKSGSDLLPLFTAGSEGIDKAVASVGQIFTREQLAKAEAYQDQLAEMRFVASNAAGTLAVALAPAFGKIADEITAAGKEAATHLPAVVGYLEDVAEGLGPPIKIMGFFARQLAAIGRVADVVGGHFGRATDRVGEFASQAADFVSESRVGDWAREAVEGLDGLTDSAGGLTDTIAEQIPISKDLARAWDEVTRAVTGTESAAQQFGGIKQIQAGIGSLLALAKDVTDEREAAQELTEKSIIDTNAEADATQRLAEIMKASGDTQANVNLLLRDALVIRQQAAILAKDEGKAADAAHKIALLDAAAGAKKSGGRGPSSADRLRAAGAAEVQDLEHMADLRGAIAVTAQETFEAEDAARAAKLAGLELEAQALELTRARGAVARANLATEREALEQESGLIVLQGRIAAREREAEAAEELLEIEQERAKAIFADGARVIELDAFRLESQARQLEAEGDLSAAFGLRIQLREREAEMAEEEFAAREAAILIRPAETVAEEIRLLGDLRQLEHERELSRLEQDGAARRAQDSELERLARAESARRTKAISQTQSIAQTSTAIVNQGMALASAALDARGVDGEKRAKIDGKIAATSAIFTGVLETVNAAAAFASLNIVQGVAHTAAAGFAFASAAQLASGNATAGGSGPGPVTAGASPTFGGDSGDAPTVPGSSPAADREPIPRADGGLDGGARVVVQIENFNPVGNFDPELVEQLATDLDNVQFSRGATG